ncbi:unnamed protein product, partial [Nesidiocoris tenuis]
MPLKYDVNQYDTVYVSTAKTKDSKETLLRVPLRQNADDAACLQIAKDDRNVTLERSMNCHSKTTRPQDPHR